MDIDPAPQSKPNILSPHNTQSGHHGKKIAQAAQLSTKTPPIRMSLLNVSPPTQAQYLCAR
jgi:hypothetical protein